MKRLLPLLFLVASFPSLAQDYHFTLIPPPQGEPTFLITGMSQDPQGYLWISAGGLGLLKYDGIQYQTWHHDPSNPNSLSTERTECVFAGPDGSVWVGSYGAGMDRLDPVTGNFIHYRHNNHDPNSLCSDTVLTILQDHKGILWIGTANGLDELEPGAGKFKHHSYNAKDPHSLTKDEVRTIYEDKRGTIWVGCGSPFTVGRPDIGGLNKLDRNTGKFTRYVHNAKDPNSLIDNRIRAIFEDSRGTFWVGTAGDGLYTMDREKGTFQRHPYDPAHPDQLSRPSIKKTVSYADDNITFISEDGMGKIWIVTMQNGANVYDPKTQKVTHYGKETKDKTGLAKNEFWYGYRTRDGVIWLGTWGDPDNVDALYKINPYPINVPYNYLGKKVFDIKEDSAQNLWIATSRGLTEKDAHNNQRTFALNNILARGLPGEGSLEYDSELNKFWVTSSAGLVRFDPVTKALIRYHHIAGNPKTLHCDSVVTTLREQGGKLWVGTWNGLDLMDINTGSFRHIDQLPEDSGSFGKIVIKVLRGKKDELWIAKYYGLLRFNERTNSFKKYFAGTSVFSVQEIDGTIWACTSVGLFKYNLATDNFDYFADNAGILVRNVFLYAMTVSRQSRLWLNASQGIIELDLKTKDAFVYGRDAGVTPGKLFIYSFVRKNGDVIIPDTMGYYTFPRENDRRIPAPAITVAGRSLGSKLLLQGIQDVFTGPAGQPGEIHLSHDQSTLSFTFDDIDYLSPGANTQVKYMLDGYDGGWRDAGIDKTAYYLNIAPGSYVLRVRAITDYGSRIEKAVAIIISPPWWTTWWAWLLYAVVAAGTIWGFAQYRSRQLLRDKRVLEHKVHLRTEEVLQQKEEIAAQRDNLEQAFSELQTTQSQLIQREKMASLGELTAGIAHEIQNPLNFVNNFSDVNREMIQELKGELSTGNVSEALAIANDIEQNEEKISHHGKRADFIVKGMLEHSRKSTGEKQPTDMNVLCDEFLKLAYHGIRARDKSFNAEMVMHFDPNLPKIDVVQQDMGRVMLNLFNNAFYAVHQKAKAAGKDYRPAIEVTTATKNDHVVICVRDNGSGIPDSVKDKIMQPFFTTKPTGEGTGLGLSISYDIVVKGHGGKIEVNTKENEFTEFIIQLPF